MERKLGKGLEALIPKSEPNEEAVQKISKLKVSLITPNRLQPRKSFDDAKLGELKDSIKEKGLIQPILVRPVGNGYELIAGERRFRAAKELGFDEIPAIVKEADDAGSLELSLIENIQREELNPVEEARAYRDLMEKFEFSQEEISKAVGKDSSTISNTLRLLTLPAIIQEYISQALISMGHAKAILSLPTERSRIRLAKRVIKKSLSVRQTEELVRRRLQRPGHIVRDRDENLVQIEDSLQHYLGTRVKIIHGKKRGRLEIFYYSDEDLARILRLIRR